jgi:hypothetical protein
MISALTASQIPQPSHILGSMEAKPYLSNTSKD